MLVFHPAIDLKIAIILNPGVGQLRSIAGLSLAIAKAEFKLRNEGSYLGILWYLLAPVLTFLLLLGIFADRLGQNIPNYPLYLLLGIILFNYFQKVSNEAVNIIQPNAGIIKSIHFHREALIGSTVLKTLFSHIFEVIVLIIFLLAFGISVKTMIFYPAILLFLALFAFGAALILSSLQIYFFDLDNIWLFASKLIWFGTPIFYAIEGQTKLFTLNLFNPMFYFITIARDLIVYGRMPEIWMMLGAIGYSLLSLIIGLFIFKKLKPRFAELI